MKALELLNELTVIISTARLFYENEANFKFNKAYEERIYKSIQELEALQNRTCESCKYIKHTNDEWGSNGCHHKDIFDYYDDGSYVIPKDFCCNRYEANDVAGFDGDGLR